MEITSQLAHYTNFGDWRKPTVRRHVCDSHPTPCVPSLRHPICIQIRRPKLASFGFVRKTTSFVYHNLLASFVKNRHSFFSQTSSSPARKNRPEAARVSTREATAEMAVLHKWTVARASCPCSGRRTFALEFILLTPVFCFPPSAFCLLLFRLSRRLHKLLP